MRKIALAMLLTLAPGAALAAAPAGDLMDARVDVSDEASLQRGAKLFANYCMGCHSAKFVRWNAMPDALGVPMETIEDNIIFGEYQAGDVIRAAMPADDAEEWFGVAPPDLSLTARSRGADWVYTYLNSYYRDPEASTGWNNLVLENSAMPHVLWRLQGVPEADYEETDDGVRVAGIRVPESAAGTMSEREYHQATRDITNFMAWMAEPARETRQTLGIWVIGFLIVFTGLAYLLKREYWRDIH
ncbi:cytochrome c1 [Spiribacter halobius]|uniref:Cytochrome c1 n=1 Tax=Sediminicurvatus halobius TaxID=2182432 RepID=A0A2U2N7W8_9GAMM|nr:cytochrome c1 [Spiribacter halobius]PWG65188.1 cytochrome c1 [Spiribacter halobius]UEX78859.1 cytochrome c1 [Spiribacter halobius]